MRHKLKIFEIKEARGTYQGPGLLDWLLGFACTILIGLEFKNFIAASSPQTSIGYYWQEPFVRQIHAGAIVLNFLALAVMGIWIFRPTMRKIMSILLLSVALLSFLLIWTELVLFFAPRQRFYLMSGVPFWPIVNLGLYGSTLYFGYMLFKLPKPKNMKLHWVIILKIMIVIGTFLLQTEMIRLTQARLS